MRYDLTDIEALQARARRERSKVIYEMLIAPLVAWFARAKTEKQTPHAARPHFAR